MEIVKYAVTRGAMDFNDAMRHAVLNEQLEMTRYLMAQGATDIATCFLICVSSSLISF